MESKEAKCPFYKDETPGSIRCEGVISVACTNNFDGQMKKRKHKAEYCAHKYEKCEHYKMVEKKYIK